jgi:hypothetical protein
MPGVSEDVACALAGVGIGEDNLIALIRRGDDAARPASPRNIGRL